jgi:hypothetical protein
MKGQIKDLASENCISCKKGEPARQELMEGLCVQDVLGQSASARRLISPFGDVGYFHSQGIC